jgi:hypothetical protein
MSFKLVDQIKKTKGIAGKHKRVLEAWASFGNRDGTNIRPSKEKVAQRAGVDRKTVYRNTDDLIAAGILVPDLNNDGSPTMHYYPNGHWVPVFHIDVAMFQNVPVLLAKLYPKKGQGQCPKMSSTPVPKCHATIPGNPSAPLQDNQPPMNPSAVSTAVETKREKEKQFLSLFSLNDELLVGMEEQHAPQTSGPRVPTAKDQPQPQPQDQPMDPSPVARSPIGGLNDEAFMSEEGLDEEAKRYQLESIVYSWYTIAGIPSITPYGEEYEAAARLVNEYGIDNDFEADFKLMLQDCPKTAGLPWKDFNFFVFGKEVRGKLVGGFEYTYGVAKAWQREHHAALKDKAQLSKWGACKVCEVEPCSYGQSHCYVCEKLVAQARTLIRKARDASALWSYTQHPGFGSWIGDRNSMPDNCVAFLGTDNDQQQIFLAKQGNKVLKQVEDFLSAD